MRQRLLQAYGRLPRPVRRWMVRRVTPSFTVGAIAVIEDGDRVLLVRLSYRRAWGLPGGLLKRGEQPEDAVRREVAEEVGIAVDPVGAPTVIVETGVRRVDVVFRCRPAPGVSPEDAAASSPEIVEARWWPRGGLPPLHAEATEALRVSRSLR